MPLKPSPDRRELNHSVGLVIASRFF